MTTATSELERARARLEAAERKAAAEREQAERLQADAWAREQAEQRDRAERFLAQPPIGSPQAAAEARQAVYAADELGPALEAWSDAIAAGQAAHQARAEALGILGRSPSDGAIPGDLQLSRDQVASVVGEWFMQRGIRHRERLLDELRAQLNGEPG